MEFAKVRHRPTTTGKVSDMSAVNTVSVILVHYRDTDEVLGALSCVRRRSPNLELELIVIDNEGNPDARNRVLEAHPDVHWRTAPDNPGFAAAVNFGLDIAGHDWVLLLNPDTRLQNAAIETCLSAARDWPTPIDIVGCAHRDRDGSFQRSAFPRPSWPGPMAALANQPLARPFLRRLAPQVLAEKFPETARKQQSVTHITDAVQGSFLMTRRRKAQEIGGFDDDYFLYCEELDFCHRMQQAGGSVLFCAEATVTHGGDVRRQSPARQQQAAISEDLFVWKRLGGGGYLLYLVLRYLNLLGAGLLWPWLDRSSRERVARQRRAWRPGSAQHLTIPGRFGRRPGSSASSLRVG
ncbi:MAG: glycosyltransferase family 2 protein [Candidatus Binatia bacterium]|nr:glycosyltransferase family 2 protein [Candidatus Binatia bacterium]